MRSLRFLACLLLISLASFAGAPAETPRRGVPASDAQKAFDLFMGALAKPAGMAAAEKMFQDFNNTVLSARSEMRRRRPELGTNVPASAADNAAVIGKARFLYMVTVRVRPGRALEYEDQIKMVRDARARTGQQQTWFVSQSLVGQQGTAFYITRPLASLGDIDGMPVLSQVLGDKYRDYQNRLAANTFSTEITISRYLPELSNPPAEIAAVDPAYWNPKPMPAGKLEDRPHLGRLTIQMDRHDRLRAPRQAALQLDRV